MDVVEEMARAIKAEIGRQFDAKPLPGPDDGSGDWSAAGGTLNLTNLVHIALAAAEKAGWRMVPAKATPDMIRAAFNLMAQISGEERCYRDDPDICWEAMVASSPRPSTDGRDSQ